MLCLNMPTTSLQPCTLFTSNKKNVYTKSPKNARIAASAIAATDSTKTSYRPHVWRALINALQVICSLSAFALHFKHLNNI